MKKEYYKFLFLILILILLLYNIILYKYKQYKIQEYINTNKEINTNIKLNILKAEDIIQYKKSRAFKNKILKQDKGLKNKKELVTYITTEDKYNKYISKVSKEKIVNKKDIIINDNTYGMTIYQKWIWLLFKKDLR